MKRETLFVKGGYYHIFNKSIAGFGIFKDPNNCVKFIETLDYYNNRLTRISYSKYLLKNRTYNYENLLILKQNSYAKILSYCIMPDHYHLLIKILFDKCFSVYIGNAENSYSRYFNIRYIRKGPLWQSRFRAVRIKSNEQLLHVNRYIILNPTSSGFVIRPEHWCFSSYKDILNSNKILLNISSDLSISSKKNYIKFINDQIDYQKKLKSIRKLLLE